MKQLREALVLSDARAISLLRQVTKEGNTFVMIVKGPLIPELAATLQCRNQVYDLNDSPYRSIKSLALDHEMSNCELSVPGHSLPHPTVVAGFTIKPSEAADADGNLELHFRLKFSSGRKQLNALLDAVGDNPFDLSLKSLQGGLFDVAESKGDGPEGGTRIDIGDITGDGSEAEEDEDPPPLVAMAMNGEKDLADEVIAAGTLPTAREMAGGTTADAKRSRRARA